MLELKYINKSDFNETNVNKAINNATKQINEYASSRDFKNNIDLIKYIIVFSGSDCVHLEQID